MKRCILLILFCFTFFNAVAQSLIYSDDIPVEEIRISPDHAMGGTVSDWITDLRFIPLKGDKNNVVAFIDDLSFNDDRIGLISRNRDINDEFFIFDTTGHLLYKTTTKMLDLKSPHGAMNGITNWDGDFMLSTPEYRVKVSKDFKVDTMHRRDFKEAGDDSLKVGNSVWYYLSPRYVHERENKEALKRNDQILISYAQDSMGYFLDMNRSLSNVFLLEGKLLAYASFSYNYKVFELDQDGISKIYNFILPLKYTLDTSAFLNLLEGQEIDAFRRKNPDAVMGFNTVIRYKDYILLKLQNSKFRWIAYNTQTQELINLNGILPDPSNDYVDFLRSNLYSDGEFLYTYIYPNQISQAQEKCEEEGHLMRSEFKDLAKHINPILVRFTLK